MQTLSGADMRTNTEKKVWSQICSPRSFAGRLHYVSVCFERLLATSRRWTLSGFGPSSKRPLRRLRLQGFHRQVLNQRIVAQLGRPYEVPRSASSALTAQTPELKADAKREAKGEAGRAKPSVPRLQ